ncbi:hypothetical protein ACTFIV_004869 [Dictyostelium citrinum]
MCDTVKIILTLLILSLLLFFNFISGNTAKTTTKCKRDYECGNYPYAACNGGLNLGYSIACNSNFDKLIVSGKYNSSDSGFTTFYIIYQYAPIHNYLYITFYQGDSNIYAIYDQTTSSIKQVLNIWGIHSLLVSSQTVYGEYGIYLINGIPSQKSDFTNSTLLYQNQITNAIILDDNDIYISIYDGKFYLGSTDCRNCTQDKLKLLFTDS